MGRYVPNSGEHAVEIAVVGIRVLGFVDDVTFNAAVEKATELAHTHNLPGRLQLDPMSLIFGRQVISPGYQPIGALSPGVLFQRVNSEGSMAEELTVERNAVTFRTCSYRRWDDVVEFIVGILCPVASVLASASVDRLAVVELRCVDRFVNEGDDLLPLSSLVRDGSPHVTPNVLHRTEQLHTHSGWFQDESDSGRVLINVNIDVSGALPNDRSVSILQVISKQASGTIPIFKDVPFNECILQIFEDLHMLDKELLAETLTDQIQQAIKLPGSRGVKRA